MANVLRATALTATLLGACALFPSLDGLSDGGKQDAAQSDGPTPDAPVEGGNADAGRWCDSLSPAPMFCDDFDDQGPLTRWTDFFVRAGATIGRDGTDFRSSPNSLLAVSPPANTPSGANVHLDTSATKSKVHVAYDMRIDARDKSVGYAEINYIDIDAPIPLDFYMRVFDDPNSTSTITSEANVDGGVLAHDVPLSGAPRFDTWTRVTVDIDVGAAHSMTVTIDGQTAAVQPLESNLYAPGPMIVKLGVGYTGSPTTSDWRIRYDNATIDWQ
jgi:hypothetical protein